MGPFGLARELESGAQNRNLSSSRFERRTLEDQDSGPLDHFFLAGSAFLINAAALFASDSSSKPNTAEYFLPITCVTMRAMFIPASPIAWAIAWPSPGLLLPSTAKVAINDGVSPAVSAARLDFLSETGCSSIMALLSLPGRR